MAPDEATTSGGEGQGGSGRAGVKLCPFPGGNDTQFPYPLSLHGAWMLASGIREYARFARRMHEEGLEDASYCLLMTRTAVEKARRLRAWAEEAAPDYLEGTIRELGELLADLAGQGDRLKALAFGEGAAGNEGPALIDVAGLFDGRADERVEVGQGDDGDEDTGARTA